MVKERKTPTPIKTVKRGLGVGMLRRRKSYAGLAACKRAERALKTAEGLFASLAGELEREMARLAPSIAEADEGCARQLQALSRQTQKALQTVLDIEVMILRERRGTTDAAAEEAGVFLDLGAAREEIESRLDRLAAA
ncbi:MAG: hypothetical protein AAF577_03865 [Pseudomonadota bacterium]